MALAGQLMAQFPERERHINELFLIENGTGVFIKGGLEHLKGNDDHIILNQSDTNKQLEIEELANADSDLKGYMLFKRENGIENEDVASQKRSIRAIQKKKSFIVGWADGAVKCAFRTTPNFAVNPAEGSSPLLGLRNEPSLRSQDLKEGKTYTCEARAYCVTGFEVKTIRENVCIKSNPQ